MNLHNEKGLNDLLDLNAVSLSSSSIFYYQTKKNINQKIKSFFFS